MAILFLLPALLLPLFFIARRSARSERISPDPRVREALELLVPDWVRWVVRFSMGSLVLLMLALALTLAGFLKAELPTLKRQLEESAGPLSNFPPQDAQEKIFGPGWRLTPAPNKKGPDLGRILYGARRWILSRADEPEASAILPYGLDAAAAEKTLAEEPCYEWGGTWLSRSTARAMLERSQRNFRLVVAEAVGPLAFWTVIAAPAAVFAAMLTLFCAPLYLWLRLQRRFLAALLTAKSADSWPEATVRLRWPKPTLLQRLLSGGFPMHIARSKADDVEHLLSFSSAEEGEGVLVDAMPEGIGRTVRRLFWAARFGKMRFPPLGVLFVPRRFLPSPPYSA